MSTPILSSTDAEQLTYQDHYSFGQRLRRTDLQDRESVAPTTWPFYGPHQAYRIGQGTPIGSFPEQDLCP